MLKALILSTAILATWLVAAPVPAPIAPVTAPVAAATATGFANTDATVLQPGTRGPVIQL